MKTKKTNDTDTEIKQETAKKEKGKFGFISDFMTVDSGSMEPNIPEDSLIFVKDTDPSTLQEDDVITFTIDENGTLATHRIVLVQTTKRCFITKGDANDIYDVPVSWSNVVGKVEFSLPKIGAVFRAVIAQENRIYVYIAIGILLALTILWVILDEFKKRKQKKAVKAISDEENVPEIEPISNEKK